MPDIMRLVAGNAVWTLVPGMLFGFGISIEATRFIRSQLRGVAAGDLPTFVSVSVLVATVTLLACFIPTLRANRINLSETLDGS